MPLTLDEQGNAVNESGVVVIPAPVLNRSGLFTGGPGPTTLPQAVPVMPDPAEEAAFNALPPGGEGIVSYPEGPQQGSPNDNSFDQIPPGGEGILSIDPPRPGDSDFGVDAVSGAPAEPPTVAPQQTLDAVAQQRDRRELAGDLALRTDLVGVEVPIAKAERSATEHAQNAVRREADLAGKAGGFEQTAATDTLKVLSDQETADAEAIEDYQRLRTDTTAELAALDKDLEQTRVDPGRWWSTRSAWQKVAVVISAALGGMLGVSNKTGRNTGLELINRMVEQDIAAQRANVGIKERSRSRKVSELGLLREGLTDRISQDNLLRANKLQQIEVQLQKSVAGMKSGVAQQRAEALLGQIQEQKAAYYEAAFKRTLARKTLELSALKAAASMKVGGGGKKPAEAGTVTGLLYPPEGSHFTNTQGETPTRIGSEGERGFVAGGLDISALSPPEQRELRAQMTAGKQLLDAYATMSWLGANRNLINDADKQTQAALMANVQMMMQEAIKGIPSDKDMEIAKQSIGGIDNPQKFFRLLDSGETLRVLQNAGNIRRRQVDNTLRGLGYGISGLEGKAIPMARDMLTPRDVHSVAESVRKGPTVTKDEGLRGPEDDGEGLFGAVRRGMREQDRDPNTSDVLRSQRFETNKTRSIGVLLQGNVTKSRVEKALELITLQRAKRNKDKAKATPAEKRAIELESEKLDLLEQQAKDWLKDDAGKKRERKQRPAHEVRGGPAL
jgi:hypothetical protein